MALWPRQGGGTNFGVNGTCTDSNKQIKLNIRQRHLMIGRGKSWIPPNPNVQLIIIL